MSERYLCERCGAAFESDDARCPKCLRKSSVREASERASGAEVARLARGDQSLDPAGHRATALVIALALSAGLAAALSLVWSELSLLDAALPALAACGVAAIAWVAAALLSSDWGTRVRRWLAGAALGVWAFVCGMLAVVAGGDLSAPFTIALGVLVFLGGIVPLLRWLQQRDEAPAPVAGKWR